MSLSSSPPAAYRGRFAPTPSGPLHAGSLVAALASWLDARAHGGAWLLRIEDVDTPRVVPGAAQLIEQQLTALGLVSDEPVLHQSTRNERYQQALARLVSQQRAYPCYCTRAQIEQALATNGSQRERHAELVYPGTCRPRLAGEHSSGASTNNDSKPKFIGPAWRFALAQQGAQALVQWHDRHLGAQTQDLQQAVGDFVLLRRDGLWAYQLAVVVDDAEQGISHIVRGEDLASNTARQIALQQALGFARPQYLHVPLVLGADGEKLSKQNGACALDLSAPLQTLNTAAQILGLPARRGALAQVLQQWCADWAEHWCKT